MNRIAAAIERIQAKLDTLEPDAVAALDANMAVEFDEHFAFQTAQARAHVEQKLTTDEALIIYRALGEVGSPDNGGWAAGTTTATKVACTTVVAELLKARLAAR